jgi:hypothetical protein
MLLSTVLLFLILWFGAACLFMVKLGKCSVFKGSCDSLVQLW